LAPPQPPDAIGHNLNIFRSNHQTGRLSAARSRSTRRLTTNHFGRRHKFSFTATASVSGSPRRWRAPHPTPKSNCCRQCNFTHTRTACHPQIWGCLADASDAKPREFRRAGAQAKRIERLIGADSEYLMPKKLATPLDKIESRQPQPQLLRARAWS
jgi:hypothetical protein